MGNLRKVIASISLVAILSTFAVTNAAFAKSPFTDVGDKHWFTTEGWDVKAKDAGIFTKTTAMPDASVIRADMAMMVAAAAGLNMTSLEAFPSGVFTDVKSTDYWYKSLQAGRQANVFSEKPKFDATGVTNRAQAAKVIVTAFGLTPATPKTKTMTDVNLSYTGADAWMNNIYTAYCYGLVKAGTFNPGANVTRAEFAKMLIVAKDAPTLKAECTKGTDVVPPVTVTGGDVSVSMADSSPDASTLADGTAFDKLLSLNLSAGPDGAKVEEVTVTSFGKVSDSLVKVSVWKDGVRVGNVVSLSESKATIVFNTPVVISANGDVQLDVAVNLDSTIGSGTVGVSVNAATDIVLDGGTVNGSFPIESPEFGIVDGSNSVAAATFDVVNLASTNRAIDPQLAYKVTTFKISETASKEDVTFEGITLFNNGNTSDKDLQNITIKDQEGKTLGSVEQTTDKIANIMFDEPYTMKQGTSRNFDVYVDVVGGSTRTAQFIVQNDYDVSILGTKSKSSIIPTAGAVDTSFPIGDLVSTNPGYNFFTVNEGSASLSKDNSSPSGDVTLGSSDVILGTFTVQAQGEDIELQKVALDFSGVAGSATLGSYSGALNASSTSGYFDCAASASCDLVGSVKLQTVTGKTLYTVSSSTASLWNNTPTYATLSAYQTIKAGEPLKLNIVGSINSNSTYTGAGESLKVGINKMYYYKKASLKYADTSSATANAMAVTTSALSVSSDTSYGAQTVVAGTSNVKLGAFNIKGSSGEKVNVTSIALQVDNSSNNSTDIKNLKVYKGIDSKGTQLGVTQASVTDATDLTLSVTGFMLEKGEEAKISVYGDVASSYGDGATSTVKIAASGVSGTGQTSQSSASGPSSQLSLQVVTVNTSGTLTLAVADDTAVSKLLVAGTDYTASDSNVAKFKFTANKAEDLYLTRVAVRLNTDAADASVSGAAIYGSTNAAQLGELIGTVHSMQSDSTRPGYIQWDWTDTSRPKILSNSSYYITVKANIVSSSQADVSGTGPKFILSDVKVEGASQLLPTNNGLDQIPTTIVMGTFTAPTTAVDLAASLTATATTITVGSASATPADATGSGILDNDGVGYYCYVDIDNAGGYPIAGGREIFYVVGADTPGTTGVYQIQRGLFGTTAAAITAAGNDDKIFCVAAKAGNLMGVMNTKLTASTDTTGLDNSAKTAQKLAKVVFTAAANAADTNANDATINKMRISVTASNADASSFVMYPDEQYNSATYAVTGKYVADGVVEFNFGDSDANGSADTTFSSTVYDTVSEGQSRTYDIKANTTTGTNGSLDVSIAKTGTSGAGTYGSDADVSWSDNYGTTVAWLNQSGTIVNLRYFSSASSTGTPDTTPPVLSSVAQSGNGDSNYTVGETLTFTFSEDMSQVTLASVAKATTVGTITATFTSQGVVAGTLFSFGTVAGVAGITFTPSWSSSSVLLLTPIAVGTAGTSPTGAVTPSQTLFMDIYGNAGVTGTPSVSNT
ncbi:MAG: S-layer homology domain-containing protein [Candidatus Peregrinibacteria bacterium]|nr:S-layer homology domain-containing protein [Candidatus Peregrinibacteria bacterium]